MKLLEVNGAVRPIYWSLGVKRLIALILNILLSERKKWRIFFCQNVYRPHENFNFERFWKALSVTALFRYF